MRRFHSSRDLRLAHGWFRHAGSVRSAASGNRHHRVGRRRGGQGISMRAPCCRQGARYHRVWRLAGIPETFDQGRREEIMKDLLSSLTFWRRGLPLWLGMMGLLLGGLGCGGFEGSPAGADVLTVGFIYIGAKDDYGYNQAH